MKRKKDISTLVLFLLVIALGFINQRLHLFRFDANIENRTKAEKPKLMIGKLDRFPPAYEKYFQDHFSFRDPLLDIYHDFLFYQMRTSPHPDRIVVGTKGRLFETEMARRIYEGKENFSPEEVDRMDSLWLSRKAYLDSKGIDFWWALAPLPHYVYQEELPVYFDADPAPRRISLLMQDTDTALSNRMVDLYPVLRAAKDSTRLYFLYDNHWSVPAGFLASQELLRHMRLKYPQCALLKEEDYSWKEQGTGYHNGSEQIGVEDLRENEWVHIHKNEKAMEAPKFDFPLPEGFAYPNSFQRHYKKETPENGLKVLFIIDSYGERLVPFLKEQFDESLFIFDAWQYGLNAPIIEEYQPDIVVFISFEKLIGQLAGKK